MPAVRHDDGLAALVASDGWETIADGFGFTEGPVWLPDGALLFSDIPNSRIHQWQGGTLTVHREPSGQSNGLTLDRQMRLIACEHQNRRVSRESDGVVETLATQFEGRRLNSPNDVIVRSDGRIFFTDPPYGIEELARELPYNGVFTISPAGEVALLATDFDRPNGLALSPDERTLYIADTARHQVRAFNVSSAGEIDSGRIFVTMRDEGRPDGMKVDRDGRVFVCAHGVQVFDANARPLGIIDCPQMPANCAWGDDGSTLYVTARTAVYRARFETIGIAPSLT
ncbi:MAG TPA: SMP-30/gluconolactonase/LRE family protein [Dehalococcoidia bacterium]